jgi:Ca2+-binding RTX toxin-like protein
MFSFRVGMPAELGERSVPFAPVHFPAPPVGTFHDYIGTRHDDTFVGTNGDDTFDLSRGGDDTASGRDGNDTIVFYGGGFTADDRLNGGPGGDQVVFSSLFGTPSDYSSGVTFKAATLQNVENVILEAGKFNFTLNDGNVAAGKLLAIFVQSDSPGSVAIDGSAETDGDLLLLGSPETVDTTFIGGAGNDFIDFSAGFTDVLDGGAGFDVADLFKVGESLSTGMTISLALHGMPQDVGGGHMVTLDNFEGLRGGPLADTLIGDQYGNGIDTNGGDDTVRAGSGDDMVNISPTIDDSMPPVESYHVVVDGGPGNDTLSMTFVVNPLFPDTGEGVNFSLALQGSTQTVGTDKTVHATHFENASGTLLDDTLTGDDGNNALYGNAGNDTLNGGNGSDVLYGDKAFFYVGDAAGNFAGIGVVDANPTGEPGYGPGNDILHGGAGNDTLDGGDGDDTLDGGAGADAMNGGNGADTFYYQRVGDSTGPGFDTITAFDAARDAFDLSFAVTAIDAKFKAGALSDASFDSDLAHAVDAAHLGANHAVLFTARHGDHAGEMFLVIDANGTPGYQAGEDLVVRLDGAVHLGNLGVEDFI